MHEDRAPGGAQQLALALQRCAIAYQAMAAQWHRTISLSGNERAALDHLRFAGPMTMSELGDRIPLSRAAITSLTDRLERAGYVVRMPDPLDRRRTNLRATGRADEQVAGHVQAFERDLHALVASMASGEREQLAAVLERVSALANEHASALRTGAQSTEANLAEGATPGSGAGASTPISLTGRD